MISRDSHLLRRRLTAVTLALGLLLGAAACSSDPDAEALDSTPTTATTVAPNEFAVVVATAKGPTLTVLAEPPPGVEPTSTTSTTAPPARELAAIPRDGLNSAGVKKTPDGFEYTSPAYFEMPMVVVATEKAGDWLRVMIPARPNGLEGWVKLDDVELSSHEYRMELNLAEFTLRVYAGPDVIEETQVVIGKDATFTPVGRFYLNEKIKQSNPGGAYGPWILSTNGYSESLDTFDGGLPVVAFHGTNQPELIGTQASNGCIRMPNDVVTRLAEILPAGTPIDIIAGTADSPA
jgi:hypothetical protein